MLRIFRVDAVVMQKEKRKEALKGDDLGQW